MEIYNEQEFRAKLKEVNLRKIRDRGLSLYQGLLGINIKGLALERIARQGRFTWMDMCCGYFNAGSDLVYDFYQRHGADIASRVYAIGVDGDTIFEGARALVLNAVIKRGNVVNYPIPPDVDLITCLKGLRYVQHFTDNVMGVVEQWYAASSLSTFLAFDIDGVSGTLDGVSFGEYLLERFAGGINVQLYEDPIAAESANTAHLVTNRSLLENFPINIE